MGCWGSALEQVEIERGSQSGPLLAVPDGLWFCRIVNKNRANRENGKMCPWMFWLNGQVSLKDER